MVLVLCKYRKGEIEELDPQKILVVRAKNVELEFTIANFPLMNLSDLISINNILINVDVSKIP